MRAVNLVPAEQRRASTGAGRSGGAAWVVLGALALALILMTTVTLTRAETQERRSELAQVRAETAAAQRAVADLQAYTTFASLREKRVETVRTLATSRFDWAHALREVSRTLPERAWLTGLRATVSPNVSVEGGSPDPMRPAVSTPAIEVQGCTTDQRAVARLVADLRRIDGVQRVSLSSSEKEGSTGAPAQPLQTNEGGTIDPCATPGRPRFSLTVFFAAPAPAAPAAPAATTISTGGTP